MNDMPMLSLKMPEGMSHLKGLMSEEISAKQADRQRVEEPKVPTIRQLIRKYLVSVFNIGVRTYEGTVTLSGTVGSILARDRAVSLARETDGVVTVNDQILIEDRSK